MIQKKAVGGDEVPVLSRWDPMRRLPLFLVLVFLPLLSACTVPPLLEAAKGGETKAVSLLLDQGADVNQTGFGGKSLLAEVGSPRKNTALHLAIAEGHLETVRVLLDRGADVNAKTAMNWTPLHVAAWLGRAQAAKLLLERGAVWNEEASVYDPFNPNFGPQSKFMTPLQMAEYKSHATLVHLLKQVETAEVRAIQEPGGVSAGTPVSDVDRVPTGKATPRPNAYAVVVGIEQYREKLPKADFADRDAKLVGEYLTKVLGYPEQNVVVRLNEKAAKTDLEKYFGDWLRNNVEPGGSVFVYYSGHGAPNPTTSDAYLVPYDGDPTFIDTTGFPLKRLYASLDKLPAAEITVVLDSCFSGAGGRSVLAKGARPIVLSLENTLLAGGKTVVLAASSGNQISSTFQEQGHGLFTYFLLKGLQGEGDANKDGTIEVTELYEYVRPNVQKIARKQYNNEQQPQLLAAPERLRKGGGRLIEAPTQSR